MIAFKTPDSQYTQPQLDPIPVAFKEVKMEEEIKKDRYKPYVN